MKISDMLLTPNKYSRPQTKISGIKGVVVHWVANTNSTAIANRNFFENRKNGKSSFGSAHYIIDNNGTIVRCIPEGEVAYHVGSSLPYKSGSKQIYTPDAWKRLNTNANKNVKPYPNNCTIGLECCHIDDSGRMTLETYHALVELSADILKRHGLTSDDLWTHQEVVGWKDCHRWFVNNLAEWKLFKQRVAEKMSPQKPTNTQGGKKVVEQWKIDMGKAALRELQAYKQPSGDPLVDIKYWEDKLDNPIEGWLFFEMVKRILQAKR